LKLQCTYIDEEGVRQLLEVLSSNGYRVSVKPKQEQPAKRTPNGNFIRWITIDN
jgi:hypothetical protein